MKNEEKLSVGACTVPLLEWYEKNRRILPWRDDPSPYHVWLSEIMLQQTRVEAVRGYYEKFLNALPDIASLAEAEEERLLKLWQGLGYYNRAKNLKKAAQRIVSDFDGEMPKDYDTLLTLPGIGVYTAGAIASIAYGKPVAAVDGNVLRVLARLLADPADIGDEKLKKKRKAQLEACIPKEAAGKFNQAWMDLGAMVCIPHGEPKCGLCPLERLCQARKQGRTGEFPHKAAKAKRRPEERTVFIIQYKERVLLHKRSGKGLLAGFYELPAAAGHLPKREALEYVEALGFSAVHIEPLPESTHIFSHLEWRMKGYLVQADELRNYREGFSQGEYLLGSLQEIERDYPIPSAFSAYLPYL